MGALLAILRGDGSGNEEAPIDINVDLEGARPTPEEGQMYQYVTEIMSVSSYHLEVLRQYNGCGDAIRKAISNPSRETEDAAWQVVSPAVIKLKDYYEFSLRLEDVFPRLLQFFCSQGNAGSNLERFQATAKRMGDILNFVSLFDELKMGNPNIQNDFSYYRRTLSRMRMSNGSQPQNIVVHDELANRMSLFYAHSTPMTKSIIDSTQNTIRAHNGVTGESVTDCLAVLAAICYNAVAKGRASQSSQGQGGQGNVVEYCLRVMVVCIIVYDHVNPVGVFAKGSKLN
ncbi:Protein fam49a, partial [Blyttiomyces sp. JEL0837]